MVSLDLAGGSHVRPETGNLTLTGSLTDDETQHLMDPELLGSEARFDEAALALPRTARRCRDWPTPGSTAGTPAPSISRQTGCRSWMHRHWPDPSCGGRVRPRLQAGAARGAMMVVRITGNGSPVSLIPFRLDRFRNRSIAGTFVSSHLGAGSRASQ
jgi:hypothetical protein